MRKQQAVSLAGVPRELTDDDLSVIVRMAHEEAALVGEMRAALEAGDESRALRLAREIAGVQQQVNQ